MKFRREENAARKKWRNKGQRASAEQTSNALIEATMTSQFDVPKYYGAIV